MEALKQAQPHPLHILKKPTASALAALLGAISLLAAPCIAQTQPQPLTADQHYWQGVALQKAQKREEAAAQFELALLLDPHHAGAFYDYALSQCQPGPPSLQDPCQTLLQAARARFGPTPPAPATPAAPASPWQGQLSLGLGYSTNYNQGTSSASVPLLIDGSNIDFEIARPYRPYTAAYHQQSLDLSYRSHPQAPLEARASVMALTPQNQSPALSTYSSYQLELTWHASARQRYTLSTKTLQDSENGSFNATGLSAQYQLRPQSTSTAQWFVLGALEQRQPSPPQPAYQTLTAQLRCDSPLVGGASLQVKTDIELDSPQGLRPGRSQTRTQITAVLEHPHLLPAKGSTRFSLRLAQADDGQPYSPLFGSTRRQTQQTEATLSLHWPIGPSQRLHLAMRQSQQQSNLALFSHQETQINAYLATSF